MTAVAAHPRTADHAEPTEPSDAAAASPEAPPASRLALDLAVAATSLLTLVSYRRVLSGHWVGPLLVVVLGIHVVTGVTARATRRTWVAAVIDVAALVLLLSWTVLPRTTVYGAPLRRTWDTAGGIIEHLPQRMSDAGVPVAATHAFLLPAALAAGLVGLLGAFLAVRLRRPLAALAPSLALFVVCSTIGTRAWRGPSTAAEVAGLALTAMVAGRRSLDPHPLPWLDPPRPGAGAPRALLAGALAVLAALVASVILGHLPGADGHGPIGWETAQSSPRIVISPLVSLRTRLLDPSGAPVFTVRSSEPSYWRLTSLDDFDGTQWAAKDTYQQTGQSLSGLVALPGSRQVSEQFAVQDLDSVWLPLAFSPERVVGAGRVSWDARSGSLLTSKPTSNGLRYSVRSVQNLTTLSPARLAALPPVRASGDLAAYLQLPADIPPRVAALAHHLVAGRTSEYAKALALQDFFYGPTFSYSLHPLSDGTGTSTLVTFLFATRNGYCQQYAGSFAVLARLVGLPTRLAVGFTTGTQVAPGVWQVTDADAHTWPEVWFPTVGWVPFEPTKGVPGHGFAIPGAGAYTGDTAAPRPTDPTGSGHARTPLPSTPTTLGRGRPSPVTTPTTVATTRLPGFHDRGGDQGGQAGAGAAPARRHPRTGDSSDLGWILVGLVGALGALAAANVARRRLRWARRRRSWPGASPEATAVLAAWDEVQEALSWQGIDRQASETQGEFAARVNRHTPFRYLRSATDLDQAPAADLRLLAELSTVAGFGGRVDAGDATAATTAAVRIRTALRRRSTRLQRLTVVLDPRLAWTARPAHPG